MSYRITAYHPRTKEIFTWLVGKRGLEHKLKLIKFEGLLEITVEELTNN